MKINLLIKVRGCKREKKMKIILVNVNLSENILKRKRKNESHIRQNKSQKSEVMDKKKQL